MLRWLWMLALVSSCGGFRAFVEPRSSARAAASLQQLASAAFSSSSWSASASVSTASGSATAANTRRDRLVVVGIGNPGDKYANTRHNAGFIVLDAYAQKHGLSFANRPRLQGEIATVQIGGRSAQLVKPATFVNLSGDCVSKVLQYYKVPTSRLLVVVDDANLPLGRIRLLGSGSSGGHNGLRSIEGSLGTQRYARMKLGIGRQEHESAALRNHVLGAFSSDEKQLLDSMVSRGVQAIERWLQQDSDSLQNIMNEFNKWPVSS